MGEFDRKSSWQQGMSAERYGGGNGMTVMSIPLVARGPSAEQADAAATAFAERVSTMADDTPDVGWITSPFVATFASLSTAQTALASLTPEQRSELAAMFEPLRDLLS